MEASFQMDEFHIVSTLPQAFTRGSLFNGA
jgi:hypothetical protein